ncbi:virulence factor [Streptococcus ferus]|uniref:virulence factor n=1 Tax=Streptococcus ferus TaxID=1345 RepID=UPI00359FF2E1
MRLSKRKLKKLISQGWDLDFVTKVQPQGNISFTKDDRYWLSGDGYHASLFVTDYPSTGLGTYWGLELNQIDETRSFMHIETLDNKDVQSRSSKAVEEKRSRIDGNQKATKNQAELDEVRDLMSFEQDIRVNNIGVKGMRTRIYGSGNTEAELMQKLSDIKNSAPKFQMTSFIGEQDIEYHAPFVPGNRQKDLLNHRDPQPISVRDLAGGYWFNHTKLEDDHGTYFGYTPTRGAVNFNIGQIDDIRTRPNMVISGNSGFNQKKFFLKHTDSLFSRGYKIINIDLDGTFEELTEAQHGKVLDFSSGKNRINIMQVMPQVTMKNGVDTDEIGSFHMHVAKLKGFAQVLNNEINSADLLELDDLINQFYIDANFWYANPEKNRDKIHITTIVNNEHPRLSDFVAFINRRKKKVEMENNIEKTRSYNRLFRTFESLQKTYASTFDVYTEFEDLSNEQVVTIDLSSYVNNQSMLNLQLFQVLTIVQSYIVNNGKVQRKRRTQEPHLTHDQLENYCVNVSSAQSVLDVRFSQSVEYLAQIIDQMGSNYAGIVLEMSSIQNILVSDSSDGLNPYVTAVRRIFSLMQYRVFANTDETTVHLLANALRGSMTESELETLPNLVKGQLFMNIAGHGNVLFYQEFLNNEPERYAYVD